MRFALASLFVLKGKTERTKKCLPFINARIIGLNSRSNSSNLFSFVLTPCLEGNFIYVFVFHFINKLTRLPLGRKSQVLSQVGRKQAATISWKNHTSVSADSIRQDKRTFIYSEDTFYVLYVIRVDSLKNRHSNDFIWILNISILSTVILFYIGI